MEHCRKSAQMALISFLVTATSILGQTPYLVKDLTPGLNPGFQAQPVDLWSAGTHAYFVGLVSETSSGLWVTDGTAAGTQPLPQTCHEGCDTNFLGNAGNLTFFLVNDQGYRVWRTDGTRAGTYALEANGANFYTASDYALLGRVLYFFRGDEFWRSDGTVAGTVQFSGAGGEGLVPFAGKLFYLRPAGSETPDLWVSDGTAAGTRQFAAVGGASYLTAAGSHLFFVSNQQVWATDGIAAPQPVAQVGLGGVAKPEGNQLYFVGHDATHGTQIWVSDGTAAGSRPVTGFTNPQPFTFDEFADYLTADGVEAVGGHLVFFATDGTHPVTLWSTDGTPQSTAALCPGNCDVVPYTARLARVGQRAVFAAESTIGPGPVWSTDGTPAGTFSLSGCLPDCGPQSHLLAVGGKAYFAGTRSFNSLWQTDGTAAGTAVVKAIAPVVVFGDGNPEMVQLGKRLVVVTSTSGPQSPSQLTVTDGTAAGTRQLTGPQDVGDSSFPSGFSALGSQAFFIANSQLWTSQGTAATTVPVPGAPATDAVASTFATTGSVFFFSGDAQVWRTDGTAAGTRQLTQLGAGESLLLYPPPAVVFHDQFYFSVSTAAGDEIWKSDGTAQGTGEALGLVPAGASIGGLWSAGGYLFYNLGGALWRSDDASAGVELAGNVNVIASPVPVGGRFLFLSASTPFVFVLWQTDGTPGGTAPVAASGLSQLILLGDLAVLGDAAYFISRANSDAAVQLWRSDGTAAGTVPVATLATPGAPFSFQLPQPQTLAGHQLFFALDDGVHGQELWATDGTAAGTRLVRDIYPGANGSNILGLTAVGSVVYFSAEDGAHGQELWQSDGTAAGTRLVQDIWPGPGDAKPAGMTQAGGLLYFSASDGLTGNQPWALPLGGASGGGGCQRGPTNLCLLGNRFKVESLWVDFQGNSGMGQAVPLTPDTGTFWFFSPDNVEVISKAIDGTALGGNYWFFYGALSDVEYWLTVTDTTTGAARRYYNPPGQLASVGDTAAFGPQGAGVNARPPAPGETARTPAAAPPAAARIGTEASGSTAPCKAGPATLCLAGGRFAVSVAWQDFSGNRGVGRTVDLTGDTGSFWFFSASNIELVLKVLDGRPVNGKFWVFYGALSDVAYKITVRDTKTGTVRSYTNPAGQFASVADTAAF
jgi:ELWxxDGT repeat protein